TAGHNLGHGLRIRSPGSTILTNGGPLHITAVGSGAASSLLFEASTAVSTGGTASLRLICDSTDIQGSATITSTGTVTLLPRTAATQINLGSTSGPTAGILELSAAELNQITTGTLQ